MSDSEDKTLPATPKRLAKARADGQVARSRDLDHFAVIAGGGALFALAAPRLAEWLKRLLAQGLQFDAKLLADPALVLERFSELGLGMLLVVLPIGVVGALIAVASATLSGGWNFTWKPLQPKFDKFNPINGIGRLFSKDQLIATAKACLLALVLGVIGAHYLQSRLDLFAQSLNLPLPAALGHALQALKDGVVLLLLALALFATIDVPLQRWQLANRLKMSHQEVKQEAKDAEGSQEVKAKIKGKMREAARRRMIAAVPSADLVVMNPTHYAVALKYDDASMAAPRVIAKGADLFALRIRDVAREAKVPVLSAPPLARALFTHTEVDQEIPAALFAAVAQVLAYVYQLRAALRGSGAMPADLPVLPVPPELDPHDEAAAGRSRGRAGGARRPA